MVVDLIEPAVQEKNYSCVVNWETRTAVWFAGQF